MIQVPLQMRPQPHLEQLQETQERIYRQLGLLVPDNAGGRQHLVSRVDGAPDLHLQLLEQHPYTSFLRLTYQLCTGEGRETEPEAHIRAYHDLEIAEVTAFNTVQGTQRLAGPSLRARALLQHQWDLNRAMDKWLAYLLGQGHSQESMRTVDNDMDRMAGRLKPKVVSNTA